MTRSQKICYRVLFGIYLVICGWIILFHGTLATLDSMFDPDFRNISFYFYFSGKEALLNVLLFIPMGLYIELFSRSAVLIRKALTVLLISLGFEVIQYILAVGTSDMMDLINNTLGGCIGIAACMMLKHVLKERVYTILLPIAGLCTLAMAAIAYFI